MKVYFSLILNAKRKLNGHYYENQVTRYHYSFGTVN